MSGLTYKAVSEETFFLGDGQNSRIPEAFNPGAKPFWAVPKAVTELAGKTGETTLVLPLAKTLEFLKHSTPAPSHFGLWGSSKSCHRTGR